MTEAQLNFFTHQTRRAVDRALKRYRRQAALGFALLLLGFLYNAHNNNSQFDQINEARNEVVAASDNARKAIVASGRAVAIDGCNRDYAEDIRIRDVFFNSRRIVVTRLKSGESPNPMADKLAVKFYNQQLKNFALPDCRDADNIITDDPNAPIPVVIPFNPDEPTAPKSVFVPSSGDKQGG